MKRFRWLLVSLIVALAVVVPLVLATTAQTDPRPPVVQIADQPTPTPTPHDAPCQGVGC